MSQRRALLLLVAYRPPLEHVQQLQACLQALSPAIGYALVVNGHRPGEPVEALLDGAEASRRFVPRWLKLAWLHRYDRWFTCREQDYGQVFEAPYLSGCCLWVRTDAFLAEGGFDPRFFLYFEDADLTRRLGRHGRTVNLPVATVLHHWGRGSYTSLWLSLVNLHSAWLYFQKWGWRLW